jgi:hypothetical protein
VVAAPVPVTLAELSAGAADWECAGLGVLHDQQRLEEQVRVRGGERTGAQLQLPSEMKCPLCVRAWPFIFHHHPCAFNC